MRPIRNRGPATSRAYGLYHEHISHGSDSPDTNSDDEAIPFSPVSPMKLPVSQQDDAANALSDELEHLFRITTDDTQAGAKHRPQAKEFEHAFVGS
jgi:hypothetical protein